MGEWVTTAGGWNAPVRDVRLRRSERLDGTLSGYQRYHRLYGRQDFNRRFSPAFALSTGLDFVLSYDWARYDNLPFPRDGRTIGTTMPPQMVDITRSLYNTAPAAYLEAQWNPTPSLRIVPGAAPRLLPRRRDQQVLVRSRIAFRLGADAADGVKGAVGLYHQHNPQFLDRVYGNPNLRLPWADQYQIGIERKLTDVDELTATLFYVRRHDLPVASVDHFSSTGQGRAYGLELCFATTSPRASTAGSRTRCRAPRSPRTSRRASR